MSSLGNTDRLVVVGSSLAGLRAAEAARTKGFAGEIVIVGDEKELPYDRPPLSKQCLVDGAPIPYLRDETDYRESLKATFMLGEPATALNAAEKTITVGGRPVQYDALVIATGASPRNLPGLPDAANIATLRNFHDVARLRQAVQSRARITIIGAGIIGAEIASAARSRGCQVTIVEATEHPLERALGRRMGALLSEMHGRNGTDLRCGVTLSEVRTHAGQVTEVVLSDGSEVATDLLLVSIGVVPNTGWLRDSGIELAPDGSIACDEQLRTSLNGVYAAGDVVSWPNSITGRNGRLETWTSANEQGAVAGTNAVVEEADRQHYSTVPYFWSDWYGNRIQFAGTAADAEPEVVHGSLEEDKFVVLYRAADSVAGALAVNEPSKIMKDRRKISQGVSWQEMVEHYRSLGTGAPDVATRPVPAI